MAPRYRMPFKLQQISSTVIEVLRDLQRQSAPRQPVASPPPAQSNLAAERERRHAAIMSMHGIWKDDPTKPRDGAEYQREVRDEWP